MIIVDVHKLENDIHEIDRQAVESMDTIWQVDLHPEAVRQFSMALRERLRYVVTEKMPKDGAMVDMWQGHSGKFALTPNRHIAVHQMLFYTAKCGAVIKDIMPPPPKFEMDVIFNDYADDPTSHSTKTFTEALKEI